jgi:hypothetical protein
MKPAQIHVHASRRDGNHVARVIGLVHEAVSACWDLWTSVENNLGTPPDLTTQLTA